MSTDDRAPGAVEEPRNPPLDDAGALIFSPRPVDDRWFAVFAAVVGRARDWLETSIAIVDREYARNPNARDGYSRIALVCRTRQMTDAALRLFDADFSGGRMRRWQFVRFVETLVSEGLDARAHEVVEAYYHAHADAVDGWATIAQHTQKLGNLEGAAALYHKDLDSRRLSGFAMSRLIELEARLGRWERAMSLLAEGEPVGPTPPDTYARLGWVRFEEGDWAGAVALMARDHAAGTLTPAWQTRFALAVARAGDPARAEELVADAYARDATLSDARARIGAVAVEVRDWERAAALMERDRAAGRLSPSWRLRLAQCRAELGDVSGAMSLVAGAYDKDPGLCDGFARIGLQLSARTLTASGVPFFVEDLRRGRTSPPVVKRVLSAWRGEQDARAQLSGFLHGLAPYLPEDLRTSLVARAVCGEIEERSIRELVANRLLRDGRLTLRCADLEFGDIPSIVTLLEEVLICENYHFVSATPGPLIIDAGANVGLATYYFLQQHPSARVVAFEPDPRMAAILRRNARRNSWDRVAIHEQALGATRSTRDFYSTPTEPMAGSLTSRKAAQGLPHEVHRVACVPLSGYLDEPVALLKLDIEGAEGEVLAECAHRLGAVEHVFCEFHRVEGSPASALAGILDILERAGFEVEVAEPSRLQRRPERGLEHVGQRQSLQIYASRRHA